MRKRKGILMFAVALVAVVAFALWLALGLTAGSNTKTVFVRYSRQTPLDDVLVDLSRKGVVTYPRQLRLIARLARRDSIVAVGTYSFRAHIDGRQALAALERPISQMVRLPETNWARRSARLLEKAQVCTADEYMLLVNSPQTFAGTVKFPLPAKSLEGYLYPDTYDLPPLLGAKQTIQRQLKAFERRVWEPLHHPANLEHAVVVASMVELEAAKDGDRPLIAGVIENRLKKKMPLQIDATILYGMQRWKVLKRRDYTRSNTPYNTYLHTGLPPGPICSPTVKSISAALNPDTHPYLYYVALPDRHHAFAATFEDHLKNIARAKKLREMARQDQG